MAPPPQDSGMGTDVRLPYVNSIIIACFIAIAWYNVLELTVIMQSFFKRHSGLYFYCLLIANWGCFFHGLGNLLKYFHLNDGLAGHNTVNTVIAWSGWVMMITGQSMVLYSRLQLVVQARWTRWVLVMIIVDGVFLHIITGVFTFLTNLASKPEQWKGPYSIIERIQVSCFFIQEFILSAIYIWKTTSMLKNEGPFFNPSKNPRGSRGRNVLVHTIVISCIIICMDVTLIILEFSGINDIQTTLKTAVYSVKLKMEFTVLNALMKHVKGTLQLSTSHGNSVAPTNAEVTKYGNGSVLRSHSRPAPMRSSLGHHAGAYSRMADNEKGLTTIQLTDLKASEVLKTTTTEVRFESVERPSADVKSAGDNGLSNSRTSSELYIIEHQGPP